MPSKILNIVLVLIVLGFIGYTVYKLPKFGSGEQPPTFTAELKDGSPFDLQDLAGQYVLLDFWGSWCAPCRRENPAIVSLHDRFSDQIYVDATGFEVISIAVEQNEARWKAAIAKDGLHWKYHIAQLQRFKSPIVQLYGVKEIPTKYLLGPDGNIISVNATPDELADYLQSKVK